MPLTKTGKEILKNFEEEYGKLKGDNYFYAWENKHRHDKFINKIKGGNK